MRKSISHAFSDRSLTEQEYLISSVIDSYILKLGKAGKTGVDLSRVYEMIAFDIIGSLAFGQTFGGVDAGLCDISVCSFRNSDLELADEPHPWISIAVGALMQGALADTFKRFVLIGQIVQMVIPGKIRKLIEDTKTNERFSIDLVKKFVTPPPMLRRLL